MATFLRIIDPARGARLLLNLDRASRISYTPAGAGAEYDGGPLLPYGATLELDLGSPEAGYSHRLYGGDADAAARALGLVDPPAGGERCVTAQVIEAPAMSALSTLAYGPAGRVFDPLLMASADDAPEGQE